MKTAYSFAVLRYVHDILTGEFVNVGVVLYAPEVKYLGGLCNTRYGRLSRLFGDIDGEYFRGLMRHIEARFDELGDRLRNDLPLYEPPAHVMEIARDVLPPDDSSLQWSEPGGGRTEDPGKTLEQLFDRLVGRYESRAARASRNDEDVWRTFKKEFETRRVLNHLHPKRIEAPDYDYEFEHAWKNRGWHLLEPISFDLLEADSILEKANRWLGRAISLQDSPEEFRLHLLLGEPSLQKLRSTYTRAENILHRIPGNPVFVHEREAGDFSATVASEIAEHSETEGEGNGDERA
mgnify:FL=1